MAFPIQGLRDHLQPGLQPARGPVPCWEQTLEFTGRLIVVEILLILYELFLRD